ncbi:MAG TPA: hypothetical protein VHZ56_00650 [Devosia sp.]|nr:hypothetical protein [Devosia sp.]
MIPASSSTHPLAAERSPWLRGPIRVPAAPSVSAAALLLAAMARGESVLDNLDAGPGTAAVMELLPRLGARLDRHGERIHVQGIGVGGFLAPEAPIDLPPLGEAGLLVLALLAAHDFETRFTGCMAAPMTDALLDFLQRNGSRIGRHGTDLVTRAPRFGLPLDLALPPGAGPLALPFLLQALVTTGTSVLQTPETGSAAEALLAGFGGRLAATPGDDATRLAVEGMAPLRAQALSLPADPGLAAYPAVAALIAPDSEITVPGLALDHDRMALLDALQMLGGDIRLDPAERGAGVDLRIVHGPLTGTVIPAALGIAPEDFAILAVAAAFASGETLIEGLGHGARRLTLSRALRANGVDCEERAEGLAVRGARRVPGGGSVAVRLDPRLAMAFLVLGMGADRPVTIDDGEVMAQLFPGFVASFEHVGASFAAGGAA